MSYNSVIKSTATTKRRTLYKASDEESPAERLSPEAQWGRVFDLLKKSWAALSGAPAPALLYTAVSVAGDVVNRLLLGSDSSHQSHGVAAWKSNVAQIIISFFLLPFLVRYQLALAQDQPTAIGKLLRSPPLLYAKLVGTAIAAGLIVAVSAIVVIPLIWTLPWVIFSLLIAVDRDYTPLKAIQASRKLSKYNFTTIWGLLFINILFIIISQLFTNLPGVATIIGTAGDLIVQVALALLYVDLSGKRKATARK